MVRARAQYTRCWTRSRHFSRRLESLVSVYVPVSSALSILEVLKVSQIQLKRTNAVTRKHSLSSDGNVFGTEGGQ